MKYTKQDLIDGLKQSIKRNEEKIAEYSKPCDARRRWMDDYQELQI